MRTFEVFVSDGGEVTVTAPRVCVVTFQRGRFNETQNVEWLTPVTSVMEAARLMREMADFLAQDHPGLIKG